QPRTQARLSDLHTASVHLQAAGSMGGGVGVQRFDNAEIVSELGCVRKETADLQSASAMLAELERGLHQVADRSAVGTNRRITLVRRTVVFRKHRLVVEGIHVAGRAVHEKEDGVPGPAREVRTSRLQQIWDGHCGGFVCRMRRRCKKSIA